jgi:lysyl-tRNA synthetase class 2
VISEVRAFFDARGFLEVETPLVVPSPGLDVHLTAFRLADGSSLRAPRYLSTSPEYHMKRLLSAGHRRIFQIAKAFREDEAGEQHNPEFTMLEWYRAPATVDEVMSDTEQLVARVTKRAVVLPERVVDTSPPFRRMTMAEAFEAFAGLPAEEMLACAEKDEDRFFRLLVEKVEPGLLRLDHAVFVTDYPASQASLARRKPNDPRVAERFELYVAGLELCNGFGELTDPVEQRARLVADQETRRRRGLAVYPIDERFLGALEAGLPPCAGNALGLDRLAALACGTRDIQGVLSFAAGDV